MRSGQNPIRSSYIIFSILTALPFIFVTVFRDHVGRDWFYTYEPMFYAVNHGIQKFGDPLFNLIYRFFGPFTEDAYWVIAFVGLVTMILFFIGICQYSVLIFFLSDRFFSRLRESVRCWRYPSSSLRYDM